MHTHAAWDPTLADSVQLRVWVFVHLCLRSSKIKTQAYYLIRPLSSGRVWRQNGEGTMTPHRWRLTPSPTLLTAPQNMPSPTHPLAILPPSLFWPKDPPPIPNPLQKNLSGWDPPSLTAHTHRRRNKPSTLHCCHRPRGYPSKNSGPPKNSTLSPSLCLILLSPQSFLLQDRWHNAVIHTGLGTHIL